MEKFSEEQLHLLTDWRDTNQPHHPCLYTCTLIYNVVVSSVQVLTNKPFGLQFVLWY